MYLFDVYERWPKRYIITFNKFINENENRNKFCKVQLWKCFKFSQILTMWEFPCIITQIAEAPNLSKIATDFSCQIFLRLLTSFDTPEVCLMFHFYLHASRIQINISNNPMIQIVISKLKMQLFIIESNVDYCELFYNLVNITFHQPRLIRY